MGCMAGERNLETLIAKLAPTLGDEEYLFVSLPGKYGDFAHLYPVASIVEREGLTLIIPKERAVAEQLPAVEVFRRITLGVHSDLQAIGLTAAVSSKLAEAGISANIVAGFYHDHIYVQARYAEEALEALRKLTL